MKTSMLEGTKFRVLLHEKGISQRELAAKINVTHFNVSRWCRAGYQSIKTENIKHIAAFLDMTSEALLARCKADNDIGANGGLNDAERDWLKVYQNLSPLEQAKIRVAVEDFVKKQKG